MWYWIAIAAIGAGIGYLGGLFGKGGAAIATPLLAAIGVPPMLAVASPLPATIPGTLVAYGRYRHGHYADPRVVRWSIGVGIPATVLGAATSFWVGGATLVLVTDLVVAALGLRILLDRKGTRAGEAAEPELATARLAGVAFTVGFLAGLLANAGGFLLVPLYLAVLALPIRRALACSLAVAAALAIPGTIVHAALGHIDWKVAVVFGLASIPLSNLGARTALAVAPARLERIYGAGLLTLGTVLLVLH
jgi:uncharacterized membrane protein YfcA